MRANEKKLRRVLKVNAIFSTLSGLLLIFDQPLIEKMGIVNDLVALIVGVGLVFFGGLVFYQATRKTVIIKQVKSIIVQDWAWVLGSIIVLVLQPWGLSRLGYWLIGAAAVIVGTFAFLQNRFLKN